MNFTDFYKIKMNFVMLWACFWFFISSICICEMPSAFLIIWSQNEISKLRILILYFYSKFCYKLWDMLLTPITRPMTSFLALFFSFHLNLYSLYSVFNLFLLILWGILGFDMLTLEFISRLSKLLWIWNSNLNLRSIQSPRE